MLIETSSQFKALILVRSHFDIFILFVFRSAVFSRTSGDCFLYDVDRNVLAGLPSFVPKEESEYLERNCIVGEPKRLCIYDKVRGP
jgi:hypothetical protein